MFLIIRLFFMLAICIAASYPSGVVITTYILGIIANLIFYNVVYLECTKLKMKRNLDFEESVVFDEFCNPNSNVHQDLRFSTILFGFIHTALLILEFKMPFLAAIVCCTALYGLLKLYELGK